MQFLVDERDVLGFGSEAIGTDAGQAFHLKPPYPCHYYMHGSGRFGLQCLTNLDLLPPVGAVIIAAPLKIKEGSGSPLRVLALVPRWQPRARRSLQSRKQGQKSRALGTSGDERAGRAGGVPAAGAHDAGHVARQARRYGSRILFAAGNVRWSFDDALRTAARFAGTLTAAGIRPGDRVALMCSNRAEFMECYLGVAWLGAIVVPINIASRGPQLQHFLQNSGARLLIIEAELLETLLFSRHQRPRA